MKILITMEVDPEYADEGHAMGVTEEGYDKINEGLSEVGTDIEVSRAGV